MAKLVKYKVGVFPILINSLILSSCLLEIGLILGLSQEKNMSFRAIYILNMLKSIAVAPVLLAEFAVGVKYLFSSLMLTSTWVSEKMSIIFISVTTVCFSVYIVGCAFCDGKVGWDFFTKYSTF